LRAEPLLKRGDLRISLAHLAIEPEQLLVENVAATFERVQRLEIARGARFQLADVTTCIRQLLIACSELRGHLIVAALRGANCAVALLHRGVKIRCARLLGGELTAQGIQLGGERRRALFAGCGERRGTRFRG
jgi:hypothetical protein